MKLSTTVSFALLVLGWQATAAAYEASFSIDTGAEMRAISPWIYGCNEHNGQPGNNHPSIRIGGNRFTGYNWETNASNAGRDWKHSSDNWIMRDLPEEYHEVPGARMTYLVLKQCRPKRKHSIVTLPMAGYVAADKDGTVSKKETAPSPRWAKVVNRKPGGSYRLKPDLADGIVYVDEFLNFMVKGVGSSRRGGAQGYNLDNEPGLWPSTHSRLHADRPTCRELVERSVALAAAVKAIDPGAEVYGGVFWGLIGCAFNSGAPDLKDFLSAYPKGTWFMEAFIDKMREASEKQGGRLLDVLDFHHYDAVKGVGGHAHLQSPRSLWDEDYVEPTWYTETFEGEALEMLPRMQRMIERRWPGTKLAITEYDYRGSEQVVGGLVQADVLGIFGRYRLHAAHHFGKTTGYVGAAFQLYRNYDGANSAYGDTHVQAKGGKVEKNSIYAALDSRQPGKLHVIIINKSKRKLEAKLTISGAKQYSSGVVWGFDKESERPRKLAPLGAINGNSFSYEMPSRSAAHLILNAK